MKSPVNNTMISTDLSPDYARSMNDAAVAAMAREHPGRDIKTKIERELRRRRVERMVQWSADGKFADLTGADVLQRVAVKHGISVGVLKSATRQKHVVCARHEAFYQICVNTNLTISQIGLLLKRDHTSILHGAQKYALDHDLPMPRNMPPLARFAERVVK